VYVCALPLYHVFALVANCLAGVRLGTLNVLIPNPRDIPALVRELAKYPFHVIPGVNTLYSALADNAEFRRLDFAPLRVANGGGMAVQRAVAEKWLKVTGVPIIEGYGLSETSPVATCNPVTAREYNGTIGLPFPNTDIAILDDAGRPLPLGEPGEIAIRGPQVMAGYWQRPDETAKVMTEDGYFKSGDVGVMDERGYIRIVDRKKDMIIVSGFNVYPNEVEGVIAMHPGVAECAAIGIPDERCGEVVKVFVVRREPGLTEDELMEWCKQQLTGYKKPRYIEFRAELPRSNVGKILRRELRDSRPVEQAASA
jgi:long-chain acyl-CoA synthetase